MGRELPLHLSRVAPGLPAFLALGLSKSSWLGVPLPADFGDIGLLGYELLVAPQAIAPATTTQTTPGEGAATSTVPLPSDLSLVGVDLFAQWLVLGPPGSSVPGATTRGLQLTLQGP